MQPTAPEPVKLFVGILYSDESLMQRAINRLLEEFSPIDFKSPVFEFSISEYYREEMGWPIFRKFISHFDLIDPKEIAPIKITCNHIEDELAVDGKRKVNLDPGYIDYNKVILASAKYNAQKIYLDLGIYADPTLWYENGAFQSYPYSFPDFKTGQYDQAFLHIRALFKGQLRRRGN